MAERLNGILKQGLSIWNKYTNKQKTMIISIAGVIILAFVILFVLINRVEYTKFVVTKDASEAAQVADLLKSEGYRYRYDEKTYSFSIESDKSTEATFLLASNDINTDAISVDDLLNNSLSTTNADRTLKLNLYLQNQMRNEIKKIKGVEEAQVYYVPKDTSNNILSKPQDTSASVMLSVNGDFNIASAETIAQVVASIIGNENADKIKVSDQNGTLLYGGNKDLYSGVAASSADYKERLRNTFINNLYMLLVKDGYSEVEIAPNLVLNMDRVEEMYTEYTVPEGMEQGYYSKSYIYKSDNSNSSGGGTPGTDANDGTDYMGEDPATNSGSSKTEQYEYIQNIKTTNTKYEVGAIKSEESSIALVIKRVNTVTQAQLEAQGLLNGTTFEAYASQNDAPQPGTVTPELINLVSMATGISEDKIQISSWEVTTFIPTQRNVTNWSDYLQIALAVLIVGLLVFVVFRGIRPVEVVEMEPELSVEQLLASTKENQMLEDIEYNEVSEVRRMIEKFVDEKPEAVAQLLRNWLNEEWS